MINAGPAYPRSTPGGFQVHPFLQGQSCGIDLFDAIGGVLSDACPPRLANPTYTKLGWEWPGLIPA